jgi:hypothetical protein
MPGFDAHFFRFDQFGQVISLMKDAAPKSRYARVEVIDVDVVNFVVN